MNTQIVMKIRKLTLDVMMYIKSISYEIKIINCSFHSNKSESHIQVRYVSRVATLLNFTFSLFPI